MSTLNLIYKTLDVSFEIISIEGNIGSGKSTLCGMLNSYFNHVNKSQHHIQYHFIEEPVKEWENIKDNTNNNKNILELFYENQNKYAFVFQTTAYITRLQTIKKVIDTILVERNNALQIDKLQIYKKHVKHILITERSLQTDKNIFAQMLYDDGKLNEIEWQSYNYWFDTFVGDYGSSKIIYVETDPEISYKRTKKRNRQGEESIPVDYLKRCHSYHTKWISSLERENVYYFDSSREIDTDKKVSFKYMENVLNFILKN